MILIFAMFVVEGSAGRIEHAFLGLKFMFLNKSIFVNTELFHDSKACFYSIISNLK